MTVTESVEQLLQNINHNNVWVGYSGGMDSHVLLEALVAVISPEKVTAIHINHNLSDNAADWQKHCEKQCFKLGVKFISEQVDIKPTGQGVEAAAREARYTVFERLLSPDDILLMGHHLDDQIETFFLRLMRGAGPDGLSGIPEYRPLGDANIGRPFLQINKAQLEDFAQQKKLNWIEDESNDDLKYDRNFLRNQVLPLLSSRWPMYRKPVGRTIKIMQKIKCDSSESLSNELQHRLTADNGLKIPGLLDEDRSATLNLIREWIRSQNELPPSLNQSEAILDEVIGARADAQPEILTKHYCIRRFKSAIYLTKPFDELPKLPITITEGTDLRIPGVGKVSLTYGIVTDVRRPIIDKKFHPLTVLFNMPNIRTTPVARSGSRDLKRLLQEYRVKPWLRSRVPLFYFEDTLVAVGDLFVVESCQAELSDAGYQVTWLES